MTVEKRIVQTLSPLGLPVAQGCYQEDDKRYIGYYVSRFGTQYADDGPGAELCLIQIHIFAPLAENINALVRLAQKELYLAGFLWPEVTDATDKDGRHFVLETQWLEGL